MPFEPTEQGRQVFSTRVVLENMNEQLHNQALLYSLCLVSKPYNEVFSKGLYRFMCLDNKMYRVFEGSKRFRRLLNRGRLLHTKVLLVSHKLHEERSDMSLCFSDERMNKVVVEFVQNMPNLVSFGCADFPPGTALLQTLASLQRLRNLSIQFTNEEVLYDDYYEKDIDYQLLAKRLFFRSEDGKIYPDPAIHVAHFRNLCKLSLFSVASVGGYARVWREALLHVFCGSPNLRSVRLSKGQDPSTADDFPDEDDPWCTMLDWISENYKKKTGHPLRLEKLVLDDWFFFPEAASKRGAIQVSEREQVSEPLATAHVVFGDDKNFDVEMVNSDGDGDPYGFLESLASQGAPKLKLYLCAESFGLIDTDRLPVYNHVMQAEVRFYQNTRRSRAPKTPLLPLMMLLRKFVNARALWLWSTSNDVHTYDLHTDEELCDGARQAFEALPSLRYVRLNAKAWKCQRGPGGVELLPLDWWEDYVECPEDFVVPVKTGHFPRLSHHDL